jgi:hypothetical protein
MWIMITVSLLLLVIAAFQRRRHGTTIKILARLPRSRVTALAGLVAILEILLVAAGVALLRE